MSAFKHIPYSRHWINEEDIAAVVRVLRSDSVTQGATIEAFEAELCRITGARYAVAVSSGTAALNMLCLAVSSKSSRQLSGVTSPISFAASANCLVHSNVQVAFADVDPGNGLIASEHCPDAAIGVLVSFAGKVVALDRLQSHFKFTIEDAAHSLGASYSVAGEHFQSGCCQHSDAAILSFHPVKHICTGEGGAALTNDAGLAEELRLLRSHAITRPEEGPAWYYDQIGLGMHYRMNEIQAALGISQLKRLPDFLSARRRFAKRYEQALSDRVFNDHLRLIPYDPQSAYHLYVIHCKNSTIRDRAHVFLKERGIGTQVHYKPIYQHTYYRELLGNLHLPNAEKFFAGCLSLPLYPKMSDAEQDYVLEQIAHFFKCDSNL